MENIIFSFHGAMNMDIKLSCQSHSCMCRKISSNYQMNIRQWANNSRFWKFLNFKMYLDTSYNTDLEQCLITFSHPFSDPPYTTLLRRKCVNSPLKRHGTFKWICFKCLNAKCLIENDVKGHCGTCTFTGESVSEMGKIHKQEKWEFSMKSEGLITILDRA